MTTSWNSLELQEERVKSRKSSLQLFVVLLKWKFKPFWLVSLEVHLLSILPKLNCLKKGKAMYNVSMPSLMGDQSCQLEVDCWISKSNVEASRKTTKSISYSWCQNIAN